MMDAAEIDAMVFALRAIAAQLAEAPIGSVRRIPLKDAAFVAGVSEAQMRRRCEQSRYGIVTGGYGFKVGSRWEVVWAPFVATLPVGSLHRVNAINRARMRD